MVRLTHLWSHDVGIPACMPFCRPLVARGWDITILCPSGPNAATARSQGISVEPISLRRSLHPPSDLIGAAQILRSYRRRRPHIVHTHNIKVGHMGRVLAYAARVPIVVHTLHGLAYGLDTPSVRRRVHATLEWIASARVDAVLAQSEEDARIVVETGAVPAARVTVIGNGIDLSRFDPRSYSEDDRRRVRAELGVGDDEVVFLSAGRLTREKGFVELIEGAIRARREDRRVRLALAGEPDTDKSDALGHAALAAARDAGVLILGRRDDMPSLYAASDVVALASWHEGVPRTLIEGAAMGKPLLASDARGCREIVRSARNGVLHPVGDAGAIARAMLELAADADRRAACGAGNREEAHTRYDIRTIVARVTDVYDRLLAEKGIS